MTTIAAESLFPLGWIVITRYAREDLHPGDVQPALCRHAAGDWGECSEADAQINKTALMDGHRLQSVYRDRHGEWFCIITEWDRSVTTICVPDDYELRYLDPDPAVKVVGPRSHVR